MSCTDPILSAASLLQRVVRYAGGCGSVGIVEASAGDPMDCTQTELPDLTLLSMAYDEGDSLMRVEITEATVDELCEVYTPRMDCVGISLSQGLREALTIDGDTATLRVLFINGETGACTTDCAGVQLEQMVAASLVTDGTDTYILAIEPDEAGDALDCATADVGSETFARSALTQVGTCDMWAWMVTQGEIEELGAFNDGFNNGFDI